MPASKLMYCHRCGERIGKCACENFTDEMTEGFILCPDCHNHLEGEGADCEMCGYIHNRVFGYVKPKGE